MIQILAYGLENSNPFVYLFFIILFIPPTVIIAFEIIDKIKERIKK